MAAQLAPPSVLLMTSSSWPNANAGEDAAQAATAAKTVWFGPTPTPIRVTPAGGFAPVASHFWVQRAAETEVPSVPVAPGPGEVRLDVVMAAQHGVVDEGAWAGESGAQ